MQLAAYEEGQAVRDIETGQTGYIILAEYEDSVEEFVYLVRFENGSEESYLDVALQEIV